MGLLVHLLGYFTSFIAPLVMYLVFKERKGRMMDNIKNALNFQISITIYAIAMIFSIFTIILAIPAILGLWALGIFEIVVVIIACIRSYKGEVYKYPLTIEFVK